MAGETGPISVSLAVSMTMAGFFAVALFICAELLVKLFTMFKRHRSLYFWSILVTIAGIVLHSIAVLLRFYALGPNVVLAALVCVGWYGMVTGFAVVLYSRLNLVVKNRTETRWVLIMIITSVCVFHIPVTVLFLGSNTRDKARFIHAFDVYERVQLTGFCIQEFIISGLYIFEAFRTLKPILATKPPKERTIFTHLILVNVFVVVLDISLLVTEYLGFFNIQTTYKPVVYALKLKMEFSILNRLIRVLRRGGDIHPWVSEIPESEVGGGRRQSSSCPPYSSNSGTGTVLTDLSTRPVAPSTTLATMPSASPGFSLAEYPPPARTTK